MADPAYVRRFDRALQSLRSVSDPLLRLEAIRLCLEDLETLEASTVSDARSTGATWSEIGAGYGLSKQGAQQRFRSIRPSAS